MDIDAEEFIAVKGFKAKGKRISNYNIGEIKELEPLRFPEPPVEPEPEPSDDDTDKEENEEDGAKVKVVQGELFSFDDDENQKDEIES